MHTPRPRTYPYAHPAHPDRRKSRLARRNGDGRVQAGLDEPDAMPGDQSRRQSLRSVAMTRYGLSVCGNAMSVIVGLAPGLPLPVRGASYLTGTTRPLTAEPRGR